MMVPSENDYFRPNVTNVISAENVNVAVSKRVKSM